MSSIPAAVAWAFLAMGFLSATMPPAGAPEPIECPGHWHASFAVYVDGERINYTEYSLENGSTPHRAHLHQWDNQTWHFEPITRTCLPFKEALALVDTHIHRDQLRLDGMHTNHPYNGTHVIDADSPLRVYHSTDNATWNRVLPSLLASRQLEDCERILIIHGPVTSTQIKSMQDELHEPPGCTAKKNAPPEEPKGLSSPPVLVNL